MNPKIALYLTHRRQCWEKVIAAIKPYLNSTGMIIDIGMGCGTSLVVLRENDSQVPLYGVDTYFPNKNFVAEGIDEAFFVEKNITIRPVDHLDPLIPYDQAQMIIKTYNGLTPWEDIVPKTSAQLFLSSILTDDLDNPIVTEQNEYLTRPEFELVLSVKCDYGLYGLYRRK